MTTDVKVIGTVYSIVSMVTGTCVRVTMATDTAATVLAEGIVARDIIC